MARKNLSLVVVLAVLAPAALCHAAIMPGYNLLQMQTDSSIDLLGSPSIPLMGIPLGTFDFGGSVGVQNVGDTHVIIERKNSFTPNTSDTIDIELVALSLRSVGSVIFNNRPNYLFVTLSSSASSVGTVSNIIESGGTGTATASGTVFVDIQFVDVVTSQITPFETESFTLAGQADFSTTPLPSELIIPGVNDQNPGIYFGGGNISFLGSGDVGNLSLNLSTTMAVVPEPATGVLLGAIGLVCIASSRRRLQAR